MNDRHSALKYHTIREWVEKGELATDRVATADNHSDLYTKAVTGTIMHLLMYILKGYDCIYIADDLQHKLSDPRYFDRPAL